MSQRSDQPGACPGQTRNPVWPGSGPPSANPTWPGCQPSANPTWPGGQPSANPTWPGGQPSANPTWPGGQPAANPTWPGGQPSANPTWPGGQPAANPTWPGGQPSANPTWPGGQPAANPTWPGGQPSANPTWPGGQPAANPTWPGGQSGNGGVWPCPPACPTVPGGWPSPSPGPVAPQQRLEIPYNQTLPAGVYDKLLITITGTIKAHADKITVDLTTARDLAFHFNPRFNECGNKVIVRNSCINNQWGREERDLERFPFVQGQSFELKILCTNNEFKVAVDNAHLLEFKHRITDLRSINALNIYNDLTLSKVHMESLNSV
ncbi:galectin-3b [Chelmon rostratus]|uniref:galectin-3b n=1 Tax=Chelmon rostratus TaxID=109905 RepID=UPI001BE89382|nr:galectin-3b [Chelmon rostratus]XP_041809654.1 galectin-3b [Chelmon rostratus]XP_041809655.1 galectin-3b [Chelmon rostratus]